MGCCLEGPRGCPSCSHHCHSSLEHHASSVRRLHPTSKHHHQYGRRSGRSSWHSRVRLRFVSIIDSWIRGRHLFTRLIRLRTQLTGLVASTAFRGEAVLQIACIVLRVADAWAIIRRTSCFLDRSSHTACLLKSQCRIFDRYEGSDDLLHKQVELQPSRSVPKPTRKYETTS